MKFLRQRIKSYLGVWILLALGTISLLLLQYSNARWQYKIHQSIHLYDNILVARTAITKDQMLLERMTAGDTLPLVNILAKNQLDGTIDIKRSNGVRFCVRFAREDR